ncbi:Do family serine endopeptidase [Fulvivirgaceae bacterium BMA10]|uniref:Do family serine endopeptidase n=1 Tax=Splendidivirga corallicola TaxID=3051826 RepID=A0ABT8KTH5_9BACT|nr:Do family serine endopeptidase [Fulvivirgaceae bacterium BMA10]
MGKRQFLLGMILASFLGGLIAIGGYKILSQEKKPFESFEQKQDIKLSSFLDENESFNVPEGLNFIYAAKEVTPGVVHIRSSYDGSQQGYSSQNPLRDFFRDFGDPDRKREARATGSGVIISEEGYIVTNNHVIDNASKVQVTLDDNRRFEAKVIGTDNTTDLALIKIDGANLPFVKFGNSDDLRIGQWVLAIGNPFNLNSTVTAGIVSARARNINIIEDRDRMQIESFIQTDAVVNPGNSGGALVNLKGELVGINTAIASPTGSYTGYSFAVPVSLVKKVMDDLLEFGEVQRALLGVSILDVTHPAIVDDVDELKGVYIQAVGKGSSADDAGLEAGDIITHIDGREVTTVPELQEIVAQNRPGDKVSVTFKREGRIKEVLATLKNKMGNTEVVEKVKPIEVNGATFENLSSIEKTRLDVEGGVKITGLDDGKWKDSGIKPGFIITKIDNEEIPDLETLNKILDRKNGRITVLGLYPDGRKDYYSFEW